MATLPGTPIRLTHPEQAPVHQLPHPTPIPDHYEPVDDATLARLRAALAAYDDTNHTDDDTDR